MSGLSRTPGKRVYGESRTAGSNPALSAKPMREIDGIEIRHSIRVNRYAPSTRLLVDPRLLVDRDQRKTIAFTNAE
jgi:hypothetical protein